MVVSGVVQHNNHAFASRTVPQQPLQKGFEGQCIEGIAQGANELATGQADGTETGDRFACGCVEQYRILDLRRHPHPAPGAVLLEVAFVQIPQFNVPALGQSAQFF